MVFAAAEPVRDRARILANVEFLERGQIKLGDAHALARVVELSHPDARPGDNSNTQYALLGLNAAREAGVTVRPEVWAAFAHLLRGLPESRRRLGLHAGCTSNQPRSMTCAGISSLILTGPGATRVLSIFRARAFATAAKGALTRISLEASTGSPTTSMCGRTSATASNGDIYYLYALERAGRLTRGAFLRAERLVSPGSRTARQGTEQAVRVLAGERSGKRRGGDLVSLCSSWPRGVRRY